MIIHVSCGESSELLSICGGLHSASNDRTAGRMVGLGVSAKLFRKEVIEELATSTMTPATRTRHTPQPLSAQHCATRHTPQRTRTTRCTLTLSLSLSLYPVQYTVSVSISSASGSAQRQSRYRTSSRESRHTSRQSQANRTRKITRKTYARISARHSSHKPQSLTLSCYRYRFQSAA